jgi:hypothetical protein
VLADVWCIIVKSESLGFCGHQLRNDFVDFGWDSLRDEALGFLGDFWGDDRMMISLRWCRI